MKTTYARRYRRRVASSRESAIARKDSQFEQPFFSAAGQQSFFKPNLNISRKCAHCEGEEKKLNESHIAEEKKEVKKKSVDAGLSRAEEKEDDKNVHRVADPREEEKKVSRIAEPEEIARTADEKEKDKAVSKKEKTGAPAPAKPVSDYVHSLNTKGQPLGKDAETFFGRRLNYDFSHVRIHTDANAQQSAKDLNARAYTVDNHIVFNKSQYNPNSEDGKKLLAHELAHVMQNDPGQTVRKKAAIPEEEQEVSISISGSSQKAKSKSAKGGCNLPDVHGQTDFNPLPSSFSVTGAKTKKTTGCDGCDGPECVTSKGTIVSTFKSKITVTLPPVPDGLSRCEADAVRAFIRGTLNNHEQEHVRAFRAYNGTVLTPYNFTGCKTELAAHVQGIHDALDAQRSADAIAASDALDPFVVPIPCNCE